MPFDGLRVADKECNKYSRTFYDEFSLRFWETIEMPTLWMSVFRFFKQMQVKQIQEIFPRLYDDKMSVV